jgi:hypothetical protein
MKAAVLYAPGDVRFGERADPTIVEPSDEYRFVVDVEAP